MAKRRKFGSTVGTGTALGGSTLALCAESRLAALLILGMVLVLTIAVVVVVLTAARGRDLRQQRNSAAVLDRLLRTVGRTPPDP